MRGIQIVPLALLPLLAIAPMFLHSGVPAFQHDWLWPADRSQLPSYFTSGFQGWRRAGVGGPPLYPNAWWAYVVAAACCWFAGPHGGLVVFTFAALLVCATGSARLAESIGATGNWKFIGSAIAIGNPFVLNEVQAGHLFMLWAYALLPWIALYARRTETATDALRLGVLLGLAGLQQQMLPFGFLVVAARTDWRSSRRIVWNVAALGIAVLFASPLWLPISLDAHNEALNVLLPTEEWEYAQSAPLHDATRVIGYIGRYDRQLPLVLSIGLWLLPVIAGIGFVRSIRRGTPFAVIGIAGVLLAAGLLGPLGALLRWGFEHSRSLALFRELYDGQALTVLAYAALCPLALALAAGGAGRQRYWAAIAAGALCIVCLGVTLDVSRGLPWYRLTPPVQAQLRAIASDSGDSRVLPVPLNAPLAAGSGRGGYGPLQIGVGSHPTAAGSSAIAVTTYGERLYTESSKAAGRAILERAEVGIIFPLPDVRSSFERVLEPRLRGALGRLQRTDPPSLQPARWPVQRVVALPFSAAPGTFATNFSGARDLTPVRNGTLVDLNAYAVHPDPLRSWARAALWPILPTWAFAEPLGIFTLRRSATLQIAPSFVVAGDLNGNVTSPQCRRSARLDRHFALLRCEASPRFEGVPPIALAQAFIGGEPSGSSPPTGSVGSVTMLASGFSYARVRVRATAGSALVLREAYDEGWTSTIPGARHVMVDGFINAWILPADLDGEVTVRYGPALAYRFAIAISIGLALAALFSAVVSGARMQWKRPVREPSMRR